MKVFIVGGTGFLGYWTTKELLKRGHTVSTVSLPPLPTADILPAEVTCELGNIIEMPDEKVLALMAGQDAFIYAAGVDDRYTPPAPALAFFQKANVAPTQRLVSLARRAGVKKAIILGSYFAYFDRLWPEMHLSQKHPYIQSRVEQEAIAIEAGGEDLAVMIMELPYIFGTMPGRKPIWTLLTDIVTANNPVFFTRGGTTMVTVQQVGQAIAGAVEQGKAGARYPIGGINMDWKTLLAIVIETMGLQKKVVTVPTFLAKLYAAKLRQQHSKDGKESGLEPVSFMNLQSKKTYIDATAIMAELGYEPADIKQAIQESIRACIDTQ